MADGACAWTIPRPGRRWCGSMTWRRRTETTLPRRGPSSDERSQIPVFRSSHAVALRRDRAVLVGQGRGDRGEGGGAVEERLAAQAGRDGGGFADGGRGGLGVAVSDEPGGVVEQAVGEVIGGGLLTQPGYRIGESLRG